MGSTSSNTTFGISFPGRCVDLVDLTREQTRKKLSVRKPFHLSNVWVGVLRINAAVVLYVLESLVHEAPVAALVPFGPRAIHKVLFTQRDQLASFAKVLSFQGSGGTECPTRATLTLGANGEKCIGLKPGISSAHATVMLLVKQREKMLLWQCHYSSQFSI